MVSAMCHSLSFEGACLSKLTSATDKNRSYALFAHSSISESDKIEIASTGLMNRAEVRFRVG
jgi:hypothetical protein